MGHFEKSIEKAMPALETANDMIKARVQNLNIHPAQINIKRNNWNLTQMQYDVLTTTLTFLEQLRVTVMAYYKTDYNLILS